MLAVYCDTAVSKTGLALQVGNAVIGWQQIDVFGLPERGDKLVFLGPQRRPVGQARVPRDAGEAGRGIGLVNGLDRADQRLRGHAADIDAGAADGAMTDEGDLRALVGGGDRGREPGGARADDSEIIMAVPFRWRTAGLTHEGVSLVSAGWLPCRRPPARR